MNTLKRGLAALLGALRWVLLGMATGATALADQIKRVTNRLQRDACARHQQASGTRRRP